MKIIVNQKNLKGAINLIEKIITKNTSLPILNNILIKTDGGRLRLIATNLEIGISTVIGVKIDEVGEITVPARIFSDFISNTGDEKITLSTKNNILFITTNKYKTQILGLDPKDFPIIPKIKTDPIAIVNTKTLKSNLAAAIDSVSLSDSRPELTGVFMQIKNNTVIIASTDSFRLTEAVLSAKTTTTTSFIIPRNTVAEVIHICGEVDGDLQIKYADNQISFYNDDIEIISRLIDGNYPDYRKVIPEKSRSSVLIKKDELEKAIRVAGLFSPSNSDIRFLCDGELVTIIAKNSEKGEIETTVGALLKGDPFQISLNYRYTLDGLKNIPTTDVILEFTGEGSPFVLKPSGAKDFTYLVMPLRT